MKVVKQAKVAAFLVLAATAILPGCGKSNNGTATGGPGGIGISGLTIGAGGTACVTSSTPAAQATFPISGSAYLGQSAFQLNASISTSAYSAGSNVYTRNNGAGDTIQLSFSTTSGYTATVNGMVTLSASTVQTLRSYAGYGYGQVCISGVVFNPGYISVGGQISGGSIYLNTTAGPLQM